MVAQQLAARDISDPCVLAAMRTVPRHLFVPEDLRSDAYSDCALRLREGQTISQPYMVAYMTQALEAHAQSVVLEVGTGSGYQAAVLAEICAQVCTIEMRQGLAATARELLDALGYDRIRYHVGNGAFGWPDALCFDGIVVTAAADRVPPRLVDQLKPGGRLVIPLGADAQKLHVITKTARGDIEDAELFWVRFVPFVWSATEPLGRAPS